MPFLGTDMGFNAGGIGVFKINTASLQPENLYTSGYGKAGDGFFWPSLELRDMVALAEGGVGPAAARPTP